MSLDEVSGLQAVHTVVQGPPHDGAWYPRPNGPGGSVTEEERMANTPRRRDHTATTAFSPVTEAERARQVVAVLGGIEDRLVAGCAGATPAAAAPLPRLIEDVTRAELDGQPPSASDTCSAELAELVTAELARGLPPVLRMLGRNRPRWALAVHGEGLNERGRTLDLVRATHRRLGGAPRHPSAIGARPAIVVHTATEPGAADDGRDRPDRG